MRRLKRTKKRSIGRMRTRKRILLRKSNRGTGKRKRMVGRKINRTLYNKGYDVGFDQAYDEGFNFGYQQGTEQGHQMNES